jgi:hypothetical protein
MISLRLLHCSINICCASPIQSGIKIFITISLINVLKHTIFISISLHHMRIFISISLSHVSCQQNIPVDQPDAFGLFTEYMLCRA